MVTIKVIVVIFVAFDIVPVFYRHPQFLTDWFEDFVFELFSSGLSDMLREGDINVFGKPVDQVETL